MSVPAKSVTKKGDCDALSDIVSKLAETVGKLEARLDGPRRPPQSRPQGGPRRQSSRRDPSTIICFNCNQPGHLARGCVAPRSSRSQQQENTKALSHKVKGHMAGGASEMTHDQGTILVSPVNPAFAYHISVSLYGHDCSFLLDTGAAVTLLSLQWWNKCGAPDVPLTPMSHRLVGVTGTPLAVQGSATLPLLIGKTTFYTPVIIVDCLTENGILGLDFLCSHKSRDNQLTLKLQPKPSTVISAVLEETTVIPAQAEMEVYVCAKDLEGQSGMWLLEDCLAQSSKQVAVAARTLVAPSRRLVTRLINPTKTATVIRKGSKVAVLSQLSDEKPPG